MNKNPKYLFSLLTSKAMTLVELLVSMVIMMIVLGAVYSILNIQQTRAVQVSRTTILQTDAQVAFTLIKWDLLLSGLGYPYNQQDAVQLIDDGIHGPGGAVGLKAVGLGFEMNRCHWSYLLDNVAGAIIPVRRWEDTLANFEQGDTIILLNEMRSPLYQNLIITNDPKTDTFTYVDSMWGDSIPAANLTVGIPISARAGLMVFRTSAGIYSGGLTYTLAGDTLRRGGEALLNNVEAIQFRYGIDNNGDGIIDAWHPNTQPNPGYVRTWAIHWTVVVTSEGMPGYTYPANTVTIEDNPPFTYNLSPIQRRRKRAILSGIVYPQNLQPEEK